MSHYDTIWEFRTKNFIVTLDIAPEETNPESCFDCADDIEAIRNGSVEWFEARVAVHLIGPYGERGNIIGADYLGACAYASLADFRESHFRSPYEGRNTLALKAQNKGICHYFPSMVREAAAAARETLKRIPRLRQINQVKEQAT